MKNIKKNKIKENNELSIDNLVNSKQFKFVFQSIVISMKNLILSGKFSLSDKIHINQYQKKVWNNSGYDEEMCQELKVSWWR